MAKLRNDYETSRWAHFLSWMKGESDALDKSAVHALGEKAHPNQRSEAEHAAIEKAREERAEQAVQNERLIQDHLHEWSKTKGARIVTVFYRLSAIIVCALIIYVLLGSVTDLPPFGEAGNPVNNEVSERYIEKGLEETGSVNIVGGMILDYRAFDTLGESHVLFVAACAVMLLLKMNLDKNGRPTREMLDAEADDRRYEPHHDIILQKVSNLIVPVILLFGIYVVLNGHLSPGGGFSGGAIMGAGLMIYVTAFGFKDIRRFFTYKTYQRVVLCSLLTYAASKCYSFYTGANDIHSIIPLGTPGAILSSGLILVLNICVGFIVTCTMYAFYAVFRKGEV